MTPYQNATKSIFRIDIELDKIQSFAEIEMILGDLSNNLHNGDHDIYNTNCVVGKYGVVMVERK
jgi:hypothetical protein